MCKETAKANAEGSCEMAKARGTMCEGKETVCKVVAKGGWNATRKRPCTRIEKAMAVMRDVCKKVAESRRLATGGHVQGSNRVWGDGGRLCEAREVLVVR